MPKSNPPKSIMLNGGCLMKLWMSTLPVTEAAKNTWNFS